jgi:glutathione S-transferase
MLRLHLFPPVAGVQPSPPCAKVETYLVLARVPFERVESWDLASAPKQKFPYVEDAGQRFPDSWFILRALEARHPAPLDAGLTPAARAVAHGLQKAADESLYYILSCFRWLDEDGYAIATEALFGAMPPAERDAAAGAVRDIARNMLHYQGYGRHSAEELLALAAADLDAFQVTLAAQPFLLGDAPRTIDCSVYGNLQAILYAPVAPRLRALVCEYPALVAYTERLRAQLAARA